MFGESLREMKGLTVKMETVTLIGKGRQNLTWFVYPINSKIFFLADVLFLGFVLDSDKYIFPWQMRFVGGSS
jgi:hypothetical protein